MIQLLVLLLVQFQIPQPTGYVNDFAGVIDQASARTMLAVIEEVRQKSRGEIVVVTLPDIQGNASIEVARCPARTSTPLYRAKYSASRSTPYSARLNAPGSPTSPEIT